MGFYVGQKVECIDARPNRYGLILSIKKGAIYTVSNVMISWSGEGIDLLECPVPVTPRNLPGYYAWRFRAVVERKTDISIFTDMLLPTHQPAKEVVRAQDNG